MIETPTRTCTKCQETFPATADYFFRANKKKLKYGLDAECKTCMTEYKKAWRQSHHERFKEGQRQSYYRRREDTAQRRWAKMLMDKSKTTARRRGTASTLTVAMLEEMYERQQGRCYWSGVPMRITGDPLHPQKVSVDRIDSSGEYTPENVVLCCLAINYCKSVTPANEFLGFLQLVRECLPDGAAEAALRGIDQPGTEGPTSDL